MSGVPLYGGPLDGATAPPGDIIGGRYVITRTVGAPPTAFTASPPPEEDAEPALVRETVVYEIRTTRSGRRVLQHAGGNTW
ncbi:hypothetical protein [Nocardiopsis sp. FR26]|uniref:hypothetical protein n=1 Tax=Nocardiopsis sp. FR26 TaxID=2605987 RepID=UPI0013586570|nr:hypothetical protein [Nocardiopsis sp. FR26]